MFNIFFERNVFAVFRETVNIFFGPATSLKET